MGGLFGYAGGCGIGTDPLELRRVAAMSCVRETSRYGFVAVDPVGRCKIHEGTGCFADDLGSLGQFPEARVLFGSGLRDDGDVVGPAVTVAGDCAVAAVSWIPGEERDAKPRTPVNPSVMARAIEKAKGDPASRFREGLRVGAPGDVPVAAVAWVGGHFLSYRHRLPLYYGDVCGRLYVATARWQYWFTAPVTAGVVFDHGPPGTPTGFSVT
jgi:hypothetical protein